MNKKFSIWLWILYALVFLALPFTAFLHAQTKPINNLVVQLSGTDLTGILNANGSSAVGTITSSSILDGIGSAQGDILYRGSSGWAVLTPGSSGNFLKTQGASANPVWAAVSGTGTVTSFSAGPLSPLFTTSVATATTTPALTFSLSTSGANTLFGNDTGSTASPAFSTLTAYLDNAFGSAQGDILYRGASNWTVLTPGTSGNFLETQGASANPVWGAPSGSGTVTSVTFTGDGILDSSTPSSAVTASGTVTATAINQSANTVLAGPATGSASSPSFRALAAADLPLATTGAFGAVKPDGSTITISSGVISAAGGGSGTVTSFSAGSLSPLFTTSVATASTTPALTFSLSTAATDTIFGNNTGSTAAPAFSSVSSYLDTFGSAQGDILYRGSSGWTVLTPGTSGNFLETQGASANPTWAAASGSSGANPTGTIGLTAVNGSATTFLRSDGAPPLSAGISPTWTGAHTFTNPSGHSIVINGNASTEGFVYQGNSGTGTSEGPLIASGTNSADFAFEVLNEAGTSLYFEARGDGAILLSKTIAGTTGAQTINKTSGQVQFAASATSLVVTDSLCTTTSIIFVTLGTNDATAVVGSAVAAAGSFTINMKTAPTGTTLCNFLLTN